MSLFCFVPNCKDRAAIPFPKDSYSGERCWKLFKVDVPNKSSFLCLQHYNDIRRYKDGKGLCNQYSPGSSESSYEGTTESVMNTNKTNELETHCFDQQNHSEICMEVIIDFKEEEEEQNKIEPAHTDIGELLNYSTSYDTGEKIRETSEQPSIISGVLCDSHLGASNVRKMEAEDQSSDQDFDCKENVDFDEHNLYYESDFNDFQNGYIVYDRDKIIDTPDCHLSISPIIQSAIDDTCLPEEKEEKYSYMEVLPDQSVNWETCRLCMRKQADTKDVFSDYLENAPIYLAIESCFSPIQISRADKLSKKICLKCWVQLKSYHKFRETVLQNDETQRKLPSQIYDNHERENDSTSPLSKRIKIGDTYLQKISGKSKIIKSLNILKQTVGSNEDRLHAENKGLEKKEMLVKIEDEVQKVLRDNLQHEQASAENTVLHVQNDSEFHHTETVFLDVKNPGVISSPVQHTMTSGKPDWMSRKVVRLAKCERKNESHIYKSLVGVFKAQYVAYIFDKDFCCLDGYLFEYMLHKSNVRSLKCIVSTCQATAVQVLESGKYSAEANVIVPHNHRRDNEADKRKHMFFSIMRRKVQSDKEMNLKDTYKIACRKDPSIETLVPWKSLLQEVCDNQSKYKPIYSFEELASNIEQRYMYKLQFTLTGKQFYQNQFIADDSRAILFANLEIVEELSTGKLMYVDSTFKIDYSNKFQLVTVLIWLTDSVFQYIHDTLAPKLRPDDIVTDYEANLYYALGEIYVESCIGGSVFYYTQNLYRKVCALDLCTELETDSYFRNVYHMLLMLPLLPVNTILDVLNILELQSKERKLFELMKPLFQHVRTQWIEKVTPDLFCVHRQFNRTISLDHVVEKLIELENFLQIAHSDPSKKYFSRDLSSAQKKNVLKAWVFIERHPKININTFLSKVLGYIKSMENQLWIWGFYRYTGDIEDDLICSSNFLIVADEQVIATSAVGIDVSEAIVCNGVQENSPNGDHQNDHVVVERVSV
nr:unnamed protein product [Callosobruchus chinensis]